MAFVRAILGLCFAAAGFLVIDGEGKGYRTGQEVYESIEAVCVIRESEMENIWNNTKSVWEETGTLEESRREKSAKETEENERTERESTFAETGEERPETKEQPDTSRICQVNFQMLQEINPEVVAWIEIPGTRVSYPVLFRYGDTDFYLTHLANGEEGKQGAIHIDGKGKAGIESRNVLIYGHNLLDYSMFSSLHSYKKEDFYQAYPYIYLHMPDGTKRQYRIAACMVTEGIANEWYRYAFEDDIAVQEYYDCFRQKSLYDTGTRLNACEGRQTILLSTCYRRQYRRLILAVRQY